MASCSHDTKRSPWLKFQPVETPLVHHIVGESPTHGSPHCLLRRAGYDVKHWPDAEVFLRDADTSRPACVLLDSRTPGLDPIAVQTRILAAGRDLAVVLIEHSDIATAVQAMRSGATDILDSPVDFDQLLHSVKAAFAQIADRVLHRARAQSARRRLARLTDRERRVLDGLACGYPNTTVAGDLGVDLRTVEVCRDDVVSKLGLGNFADALRIAFAAGWGPGACIDQMAFAP